MLIVIDFYLFFFPSGLQHSETRSKPSLSEKEPSKEESDAQPHGHLSSLEQLQCKLTTQVLETKRPKILAAYTFSSKHL